MDKCILNASYNLEKMEKGLFKDYAPWLLGDILF